ncbi:hypothetical protein ACWEJS_27230, partial [Rhodococcus triatomae]
SISIDLPRHLRNGSPTWRRRGRQCTPDREEPSNSRVLTPTLHSRRDLYTPLGGRGGSDRVIAIGEAVGADPKRDTGLLDGDFDARVVRPRSHASHHTVSHSARLVACFDFSRNLTIQRRPFANVHL